jgi:RNA polymerase sigma factor (sigma-70 family)
MLQDECEDVAMETLSDILDSGANVASDEELKPLTAAIARNKASDRLRRHLAEKRGGNNVQSLELIIESNAGEPAGFAQTDFFDQLTVQELRKLLTDLSSEVKKEYRVVLRDHFFDHLSYQEIAERRKISLGSVGVYLQRGLGSLRTVLARKPKLRGEFLELLSDAASVRVVLPMLGAMQTGKALLANEEIRESRVARGQGEISDEERLQLAQEGPEKPLALRAEQQSLWAERLRTKYPTQYEEWQQALEERRRRKEEFRLQWQQKERRSRFVARLIFALVATGLIYGFVRLILSVFSK